MLENNYKQICETLERNPELINKLEYTDNLSIIGKVMELCLNNKYKLTLDTPSWLMKRLSSDVYFVKNKLEQDFTLIHLFKKYVNNMIFIRDDDLYNICLKNKYLLSKDSPLFLYNNFSLFIHSLKAGSIKFEDVDLKKYLGYHIDDLTQIVSVADSLNYSSDIIEEMRNKVINHYFYYEKGKLYISNLSFGICNSFKCFSSNINGDIYICKS